AARLLPGQHGAVLDPARGAGADADLGGGRLLGVGPSERHVSAHLSVVDPGTGHSRTSSRCDWPKEPDDGPPASGRDAAPVAQASGRATPSLWPSPPARMVAASRPR